MLLFPTSATDVRVLSCPACQTKNRVFLSNAIEAPERVRCGHCQKPLLCPKESAMSGLLGRDYQHPLDRQSLDTLESIPGMNHLMKRFFQVTIEKYNRIFHESTYIKVGSSQVPSLLRLFEKAAYSLGLVELPDLYLYQSPEINAFTGGSERAYVAISSSLCDIMTDEEICAIFAHELAHWQSKHMLYKTAARLFTLAAGELAKYTLGIGNLVVLPVQLSLLTWDRCSELSADRGMLLATKDPILCLRVLMKLSFGSIKRGSELSLQQFMQQALASKQLSESTFLDKVYTLFQTVSRTHPFPLWRAAELWKFVCEGEYLTLLQRYA